MSNPWADYEEPEIGDMFVPKDNIGHVLVIKTAGIRTGIVTSQSPDGTDAVAADLVDLNAPGGPATYRDTRLFGGAFVDALRPYIGRVVAVRVEQRTAKSGRQYCHPASLDEATTQRARAWVEANNPFAEAVGTVAPAPAPASAQDPWATSPVGGSSVSTWPVNTTGTNTITSTGGAQAPFATEEPPF